MFVYKKNVVLTIIKRLWQKTISVSLMSMAKYPQDHCNCKTNLSLLNLVFGIWYFIYLPHDYNNYKRCQKKKCRKRWRGGLKETIELMLIRPPQLQFFEDGIKITATDTI